MRRTYNSIASTKSEKIKDEATVDGYQNTFRVKSTNTKQASPNFYESQPGSELVPPTSESYELQM